MTVIISNRYQPLYVITRQFFFKTGDGSWMCMAKDVACKLEHHPKRMMGHPVFWEEALRRNKLIPVESYSYDKAIRRLKIYCLHVYSHEIRTGCFTKRKFRRVVNQSLYDYSCLSRAMVTRYAVENITKLEKDPSLFASPNVIL